MSPNNPLMHTIEKMFKEGINNMKTKHYVVKTAINHHKEGNKIETVNKTDKPQAYKSKKCQSISNESNKSMALDKTSSFFPDMLVCFVLFKYQLG